MPHDNFSVWHLRFFLFPASHFPHQLRYDDAFIYQYILTEAIKSFPTQNHTLSYEVTEKAKR